MLSHTKLIVTVMTRILESMFMGHAPTVTLKVMTQTPANMFTAVVRKAVILMHIIVIPVSMFMEVAIISISSI